MDEMSTGRQVFSGECLGHGTQVPQKAKQDKRVSVFMASLARVEGLEPGGEGAARELSG